MATDQFDDDIPKIVLEKEDREAFRRSRMKDTGKAPPPSPSEPAEKSTGASSAWVFVIFLIAAASAGACYWLYTQKVAQDQALADAQNRIQDLERRLSATGEEMDQSAVALQVKVTELSARTDELWSQMDKLWASAWRRNQAEIEELGKKLTTSSDNLRNQVAAVEKESGVINTNLAVFQERLAEHRQQLEQLVTLTDKLAKTDNDMLREIDDIKVKLVATDQITSTLSRRLAELEKWKTGQENSPAAPPPIRQTNGQGN